MNTQYDLPLPVVTQVSEYLTSLRLPSAFSLNLLAGDGSPRKFFRLTPASGSTFILLLDPEWILSRDYAPHQAFLNRVKIPVPAFLLVKPEMGFLLMEDIGDDLLQFYLQKNPSEKSAWLEKSMEILADLHGKIFPVPKELPCSSRRFDQQKYQEELLFTWEHLAKEYLKEGEIAGALLKKIKTFCKSLEKICPAVFSHRDYHIRNILIKDQKLFLIDFQDARLGPPHYDVASLLWDPYMPIEEKERLALKEIYIKKVQQFPALQSAIQWETFDQDLKRVAFQRLVKAAGSYASFYNRYGKQTHLPYLKPALERAQALVLEISDLNFLPLGQWLDKINYEKN